MDSKKLQNTQQQRHTCCGCCIKTFFSEIILRVIIPRATVKNLGEPIEWFSRNTKKVTICKNGQKISGNSCPGESDRCDNNVINFFHKDNTEGIKSYLQSYQTDYCFSVRNSEIYKQTDKKII